MTAISPCHSAMGKQQTELISAVRHGDVDRVRKLLERVNATTLSKLIGSARKINVNCADDQGMTALHHAVLTGNADLVRLLVENGSEVDVIDKRGLRPLHYAAWKGDAATVELLCCHGNGATATVNPSAIDGYTPLHVAAEHGHYNVVERLLRWGADPTRVNDRGRTPLDVACEFGRALVVDLLTNWIPATRLVATDKNQTTCLHLAARNGHADVIRILIRAGVDINKQTSRGTCLHEATMFGKADVVRYLLTHGADVNRVNSYEQTALDVVSKFTANRAAHQIEQMLRDTSCASFNTTSQQLRHAMPFSQTCSDLPTSYNYTSRDPIAILSARRLSGSSMDPFARLSESSPAGKMSSDGREYTPSSVSYNDIRNGGAGHVNHSRIGASSSPTSSNSSLTSTSFDSPIQTTGGVDLESVAGSRDDTLALGGNNKDCDGVYSWLASLQLAEYYDLFAEAGYDMPTISRMTPEDLTAIGITKPSIRKRLKAEIGRLGIRDATPEFHPASVKNLLQLLHIEEYMETLSRQGYTDMDELLDITWEDLEEIGIRKLGHQKKMMLALDRLKRLNRVRTTTSNGTPASFRRSSATSSSTDCGATGPLHLSVHRTHSAVSDSRRYAVHGARAYRPSAGGNSSSLDYFADRQMSATRMTQQMPFGPAYNRFEGDSSKSLTSSDRYGSVFPERPRSRLAMSSAPSVTFSNSSDACAIRVAGSSMLTTAATMPDIVGRTLAADDDDETSLTSGPVAVSPSAGTSRDGEKTPTNAQETHHTPLFAAYCNRQRQLETNFTARAGPNWVVPSASWSGLMQRRIPSTDVATFGGRPSAKVLPSPKPQQSTNGSDIDHHVTDYFRPKTTAEGYHLPAKTTATNNYSTYATLPRKTNPMNVHRQLDSKHDEDNSNGKPEVLIDTDENGGGRGISTAQSQTSKAFSEEANINSKNFVAREYTRPSSAAPSASSSRSRTMKPTPPKRTNSFKTESTTVPGDEPTDFDDVGARRRRGVPSGSVAGVRRHDSDSSADHSVRRSIQETPMATVSEPGNCLSASAPSIDESGVAPKRRLEEVVVDSDAGSREQSTMSPPGITLRTSAARRQSTDSGSSSDPTSDGVMPFANEDMGTIKVHRAGITATTTTSTTGNVAGSNADVVHAEKHVTFQRPEYVAEYSTETSHRYVNLSDDCKHDTGLHQRATDNGDGGEVCMTSSRFDRCHDNGSAPAIVRSGSSVLLKDIDGMLNGLSLELDMMLQSHT